MATPEQEALQQRIRELETENDTLRRERDELHGRERNLFCVVTHTPSPIYLKDASFRYLLVNPFYEKLAHVPLAALRGKTDYDIFPKAVADVFREQDEEIVRLRGPREFEETIPLPDGTFTFITVKFPVFDDSGALQAVGGFCTDITARKGAEQEREALIAKLRSAHDEVATLRTILPICAWCKEIRDDQGYWTKLEHYLGEHADLDFTHSICPSCEAKLAAHRSAVRG